MDAGIRDKSCVWWPQIEYPFIDLFVSNVNGVKFDYFMIMFFNFLYKNSLI